MTFHKNPLSLFLSHFLVPMLLLGSAAAQAIEVSTSGFVSLIAGKVLSGQVGDYLQNEAGYHCPCFIADYPNAGVYQDEGWDFAPDSRAGIQIDTQFSEQWQLSTQVTGHGGDNMKPELGALFLGYQAGGNWSFNVGRQRLPLFYFSDFYDVGYAYPWIRVPGDLYGWPINNYNGVSVSYNDDLGSGTLNAEVFAGEERDKDARQYQLIYYVAKDYTINWKKMAGAVLSYTHDWFDARLIGMTNRVDNIGYGEFADQSSLVTYDDLDHRQKFFGFATGIDYHNVVARAEFNHFEIPVSDMNSNAKLFSVGYRIHKFTPTLAYSRYDDKDPSVGGTGLSRMRSFTLRWDFRKNMAAKLQYDYITDGAKWVYDDTTTPPTYYANFIGNTRNLSLGVDYVF